MSYLVYEVAPKYFAGEAEIASNYSTFRVPYWDKDIVKLAYEKEYSTISFSRFLKKKKKDTYRENIMQTYVISKNPKFRKIPIHGIPLSVFMYDSKPLYQLGHLIHRGYPLLKRHIYHTPSLPPLEDWPTWFKYTLRSEIEKLLNEDSLICDYIDKDFVLNMREANNIHYLGKLATVEILLNLIKNGWTI